MATEGIKFEPPAQSRAEDILYTTLQRQPYEKEPESRIEDLLVQLNKAIISGSGFTPTETQLTAMNSGIDSEKVAQIGTNKTDISNLGTSLSSTSSDEGKVLTADGQEGYSWQAPQSGGGKKYLYQCDVMFDAGSQVNRLRFNVQFISSNPDLEINGNISYSDLFSDYLKLSGTSGYVFITNIANVTLSESGANNPFLTSSFHRINLEDGHWFLWLSNGVKEFAIANNTTVQIKGTKTEI